MNPMQDNPQQNMNPMNFSPTGDFMIPAPNVHPVQGFQDVDPTQNQFMPYQQQMAPNNVQVINPLPYPSDQNQTFPCDTNTAFPIVSPTFTAPQYFYNVPQGVTVADNTNIDHSAVYQEVQELRQKVTFWRGVAEQQSQYAQTVAVEKNKELQITKNNFETLKMSHFLLKKLYEAESKSNHISRSMAFDNMKRLFHSKFEAVCPEAMVSASPTPSLTAAEVTS